MENLFDDIKPQSEPSKTLKTPLLPADRTDSLRNDKKDRKKNKDLEQRCQQLESEILQFKRTDKNRK